MALLGGLSLILPMLIMTLHPCLLMTLVTTSFFVLVVGVVLAGVMGDAERKHVVAATAAYAAVLVVFVGTVGGGSNIDGTSQRRSSVSNGKVGGTAAGSIMGTILLVFVLLVMWTFVTWRVAGYPLNCLDCRNLVARKQESECFRSVNSEQAEEQRQKRLQY